MSEEKIWTFNISVDGNDAIEFKTSRSIYSHAAMEAWGKLDLPYPCTIAIWCPELEERAAKHFFQIGDFRDMHGNVYVCPSVMLRGVLSVLPESADK